LRREIAFSSLIAMRQPPEMEQRYPRTCMLPLRYGAWRSSFEENLELPRERVSGWPRLVCLFTFAPYRVAIPTFGW
jgi:hypothetical protein